MPVSNELMFHPMLGGRYQGLIGDPNMLGLFVSFLLLWLVSEVSAARIFSGLFCVRVLLLVAALAILAASLSRSAWLNFLVGLFVFLVTWRRRWRGQRNPRNFVFLCGFALACLVAFNVGGGRDILIDRLWMQNYEEKERERYAFYYTRRALSLAMDHPMGVGTGRTGFVFQDEQGLSAGAHNTYINILSDNGWLAFLFFVASVFAVILMVACLRVECLGVDPAMIRGGIAGLLVNALWQDTILWNIAWIAPGLACAMFCRRKLSR